MLAADKPLPPLPPCLLHPPSSPHSLVVPFLPFSPLGIDAVDMNVPVATQIESETRLILFALIAISPQKNNMLQVNDGDWPGTTSCEFMADMSQMFSWTGVASFGVAHLCC